METYRKNWKIFFRNRALLIATIAYFAFLLYWLQNNYFYQLYYKDSIQTFRDGLEYVIAPYGLFLCLGYEMGVKHWETNLSETLAATGSGVIRTSTAWLGLLATLALLNYLLPMAAVLPVYVLEGSGSGRLLAHILLAGFLYHFLTPLTGGAMGMLLAAKFRTRRFPAYGIIIALVLLTTDYVGDILSIPSAIAGKPGITNVLYWIKDAFMLTPYGLAVTAFPDRLYGIPMEPYRWMLAAFWLGLSLFVLLYKDTRRSRKKRRVMAILGLAAGLCLTGWVLRGSRVILDNRPESLTNYDQDYYRDRAEPGYDGGFAVERYDMDLWLYNELSATVTMKVTPLERGDEYVFTLYHRYGIRSVADSTGASIPFERKEDLLTIASADMPQDGRLTVRYAGWSPKFYSNSQGTALPGYFAYYPMAGNRPVYVDDQSASHIFYGYNQHVDEGEHDFSLRVHAPYTLCTNIPGANNRYAGRTHNLTLMGGMMRLSAAEGGGNIYRLDAPRSRTSISFIEIQTGYEALCARVSRTPSQSILEKDVFELPSLFGFNSDGEDYVDLGDHALIHQDVMSTKTLLEMMAEKDWVLTRTDSSALRLYFLVYFQRSPEEIPEVTATPREMVEKAREWAAVSDPYEQLNIFSQDRDSNMILQILAYLEASADGDFFPLKQLDQALCQGQSNSLGLLATLVEEAANRQAK